MGPMMSIKVQIYCSDCDADGGEVSVLVQVKSGGSLELQYPEELSGGDFYARSGIDYWYVLCGTCLDKREK